MRRIVVTFALAFRFFPSTGSNSAIRTVFRPVGFRQIVTATEYTFPPVCPVEQGGAQASVQGQDGGAEPFADQRVGNTLCESIVKRRKRMTNDAVRMRMTLWKKNSSNYTAPFANAMIADL